MAQAAVHTLPTGETVFAGQRNDGFFVDLGAIFDLGDLRPFQHLHLIPSADAVSVDTLKTMNVHTIAIQIPIVEADYVYVMDFDGDRIRHLMKIWNDGISLTQLGWT